MSFRRLFMETIDLTPYQARAIFESAYKGHTVFIELEQSFDRIIYRFNLRYYIRSVISGKIMPQYYDCYLGRYDTKSKMLFMYDESELINNERMVVR